MNDVKEMINVVTLYIKQRKGVSVSINYPRNSVELKKLTIAYNIALNSKQ